MTDADQGQALRDLEGRIRGLEARLSASEAATAFLDSVLRAVPAIVVNVDPSLRIRYLNRYQPGFTAAETVGRHIREFIAADDVDAALQEVERARATGKITAFFATQVARADGSTTSYVTYVAPLMEPDGSVGVCLAAVDVSEERARERALRESEEKLRLAVEATGLGVWTWNIVTHELDWDENMRAIHGGVQPRDPEHYFESFVHPDDRELVQRNSEISLKTGKAASQVTHRVVWPDGTVRWVLTLGRMQRDEGGKQVRVIGGSIDVTRNYELEEQLRQSQKMEAVGSLTAGIAHNFNNMLAVILPTLEVAIDLVPPVRADLMRQALHAATRASELVRQLMTYAGQSRNLRQRVCSVVAIAESAVGICQRTLEPHIRLSLQVDLDARELNVEGNAVQLEQVFVNLTLNARDAIVEAAREHGLVTVHVRKGRETLRSKQGVLNEAVCIDVCDNGVGIPEQVRPRIFEPFFTTKPAGRGTGLGLATSFGTIRDHGGTLVCGAGSDLGAQFTVTLPVSGAELPVTTLPPPSDDVPLGTRILVVDDDAAVRGALGHVLASAGLTVYEAGCGHTALRELASCPEMDVVLLDRAMPGGSGEQFVPRMRELAPAARLVFLSGQSIEPSLERLVDAVVPKPVSSPDLLRTIRQVLDRAAR
jgi:two-component system cell cycle sensor histidine kinase/response regulator CckA